MSVRRLLFLVFVLVALSGVYAQDANAPTQTFIRNSWESWGDHVVIKLQTNESSAITGLAEAISWIGVGILYGAVALFLLYYYNFVIARNFIGLLLFAVFINTVIKMGLAQPRPFWTSTEILGLECRGDTFGVPSGHMQFAIVVSAWLIMVYLRRKSAQHETYRQKLIGGFLLSLLVFVYCTSTMLARMYLGVHYLHDVLLGWAIGVVCFFIWRFLIARTLVKCRRFASDHMLAMLGIATLVFGAMVGLTLGLYYVGDRNNDLLAQWQRIASVHCPGISLTASSLAMPMMVAGATYGVMLAVIFERRYVLYHPAVHDQFRYAKSRPLLRGFLAVLGRLVIGAGGAAGIYFGMAVADDSLRSVAEGLVAVYACLRGIVVGLWVMLFSLALMVKLKVSSTRLTADADFGLAMDKGEAPVPVELARDYEEDEHAVAVDVLSDHPVKDCSRHDLDSFQP